MGDGEDGVRVSGGFVRGDWLFMFISIFHFPALFPLCLPLERRPPPPPPSSSIRVRQTALNPEERRGRGIPDDVSE